MAKKGRHGTGRGPGGPSRPARSGRVTSNAPAPPPGVQFQGPSIDRVVEALLGMVRTAAPVGVRGRALHIEQWADHMAVSVYAPDAMPRVFYTELAEGLDASPYPDAAAVRAALATALGHKEARPLWAAQERMAARLVREGRADEVGDDLGIGRARPTRALEVTHGAGDGVTIVVDFDQPGGAHSIGVEVDHDMAGRARDLSIGPPWDEQEGRDEMLAVPGTSVSEMSLADARTLIEHAIAVTDNSPDAPVSAAMADVRRLVERRLALLPRGGRAPSWAQAAQAESSELPLIDLGPWQPLQPYAAWRVPWDARLDTVPIALHARVTRMSTRVAHLAHIVLGPSFIQPAVDLVVELAQLDPSPLAGHGLPDRWARAVVWLLADDSHAFASGRERSALAAALEGDVPDLATDAAALRHHLDLPPGTHTIPW